MKNIWSLNDLKSCFVNVSQYKIILLRTCINFVSNSSFYLMSPINLILRLDLGPIAYRKVRNSNLSWLVACFQIFRRFMKGKLYAYVLWPLAKKFQNWIVDRSTACDFTVMQMPNLKFQSYWDSLEHSRVNESAKKISVRTKTTCDVFVKQKCLGTP